MSVDTRTPRTHTGGRSSAPADEPVLSMVKVASDPAQVIVNHASFRVQLGATSAARALGRTVYIPVAAGTARRAAPVVWSGRSTPGDEAATQLLQAVRNADAESAGSTTQVLPRIEAEAPRRATVAGPRRPSGLAPGELLGGVQPARGAFDDEYEYRYEDDEYLSAPGSASRPSARPNNGTRARPRSRSGAASGFGEDRERTADPVKHAWYPGRRMNLGIVLLPLRVFLGFISIYAGMGKLCDPVYFDGGERGSMVTWLASLHPWAAAEPLRNVALNHPVGSGLTIAFLQVVVGVLTVAGLWQRVAASLGALLSAALLVTVSWRIVPAYDAPDIIYLAAWSPLVIAGAPVYSVDGRLASEAWRRLGPRAALWDLRRRVLRRGTVIATVLLGLTLVVGSTLGAAVRSTTTRGDLTGPSDVPTNNLQGSPLPEVAGGANGAKRSAGAASTSSRPSAAPSASASPSTSASTTPVPGATARHTAGTAGGSSGGYTAPSHQQTAHKPAQPRPSHHSSAPAPSGGSSSGGGSSGGALGGLLGSGLLGMHSAQGGAAQHQSGLA
ncbi:DoxX family membrane protein [Actinacidiphila oryziradicis]|uniref:DoxX family membrane protein n=1 Tax=Actinacidiphila oryziradicis TaxID=2571141 RepID=UPI0023F2A1F9|nr:DoxX family membrane protein [Actinacidiphila oryziradicis]